MSMKLTSFPGDALAAKALIAAQYNSVDIEVEEIKLGKANKQKAFKAKHPLNKVPVLETSNGFLIESDVIARYVASQKVDTSLLGGTFWEQTLVNKWVAFASNEVAPPLTAWVGFATNSMGYNPKNYNLSKIDAKKALAVLEAHLAKNMFFVGKYITLADITVACAIRDAYCTVVDKKLRDNYQSLTRWFKTVSNRTEFKNVFGQLVFAAEEKKPVIPKKQPQQKKKKAPVQQQKKKAKNPLDILPKSKMILDACKKGYFSVRPYNTKFFDTFWKNYDAAGYSIYSCEYKYPEDFKYEIATRNLMGMFLQRCSGAGKYSFGALHMDVDDIQKGPFQIYGAMLFRGPGIPAEMQNVNDFAEYSFTKLDHTNEKDRALFQAHFEATTYKNVKVEHRQFLK